MRFGHRDPVPDRLRRAIVALGNFDGFHLGHQAVVAEAVSWARAEGGRRRGRHVRAAPGAPLRAARAVVPADQPRAARGAVRRGGRPGDAGVRFRRRPRGDHGRGLRRPAARARHRRGGRGDRGGLHLRQGARRQCRPARRVGRRTRHRRARGRPGRGRRAAGLVEPGARTRSRPASARPRRG